MVLETFVTVAISYEILYEKISESFSMSGSNRFYFCSFGAEDESFISAQYEK